MVRFWTLIWFGCLVVLLPFVLLVRLSVFVKLDWIVSWILFPLAPFGWLAGYAYKRMQT